MSGNTEFALGTYPWVSIANVGNAGPSSVRIVPARGGASIAITDSRALNTSPVWMPNARALLYISNRDGARDVYRAVLDDDGKPVGEPQRLTTGLGVHTISLSADGRVLAYSVFRVVANIWSVTVLPNGEQVAGEATPVTRGTQSVEGLALSSDGSQLAFDSDRNGNHHIYTVPADGGESRQITTGSVDEFMPHWSPDGREIVFHAFTREAARRLQVVTAEGGSTSAVATAPRNQRRPGWSPDGRAFFIRRGQRVVERCVRDRAWCGWVEQSASPDEEWRRGSLVARWHSHPVRAAQQHLDDDARRWPRALGLPRRSIGAAASRECGVGPERARDPVQALRWRGAYELLGSRRGGRCAEAGGAIGS